MVVQANRLTVTGRLRTQSNTPDTLTLYGRVKTLDLSIPAGAVGHRAYVITHSAVAEYALAGYNVSARSTSTAVSGSLQVLGQVRAPNAQVYITSTANGGGGGITATYGPLTVTEASQAHTPEGWETQLSVSDTTEADHEPFQELLAEKVPWERERQYWADPEHAAEKARQDALDERERNKLPCKDRKKLKFDKRSYLVDQLVQDCLAELPFPVVVTASPPFPGCRFYAETDRPYNGERTGTLGVTYSTLRKKPLEVMNDIWGRVGWTHKFRGGVCFIGPPQALLEPDSVAPALGVTLGELTQESVSYISEGAHEFKDVVGQVGGSFDLPRWITPKLATIRYEKPPLPPGDEEKKKADDPNGWFETVKDGVLKGEDSTYRADGKTLQSIRKWEVEKKGGRVIREQEETAGLVPVSGGFALVTDEAGDYKAITERWATQGRKFTTHSYGHPLWTGSETGSRTQVYTYMPFLDHGDFDAVILTEDTATTHTWNDYGYPERTATTSRKFSGTQQTETDLNGDGASDVFIDTLIYEHEEAVETWLPLGGGEWLHRLALYHRKYIPQFGDGAEIEDTIDAPVFEVTSEITDQGPQRAQKDGDDCPEDEEEPTYFTYDIRLEGGRVYTGGRGDEVEVDLPWCETVPPLAFEYLYGAKLARKELSYTALVPLKIPEAGGDWEFSATGEPGAVSCTVKLEEKLPKEA
ncbi:hypothetical protein SAMN00790413_01906 [Deinococcus hopiensis KR-140]|uniref:Uncharacterized protein n=1 Tax=Deinococcus hopiensis KR-140 TaxID=695939 RepID=A0A1W1VIP8_9DEIO|nr:hypothetical protein SAMN00790413_01906 [Deinococcus hopiensis KR-140]